LEFQHLPGREAPSRNRAGFGHGYQRREAANVPMRVASLALTQRAVGFSFALCLSSTLCLSSPGLTGRSSNHGPTGLLDCPVKPGQAGQ
jgi:hypothetical protein